jgi:hypothetical protein
MAIDLARAEKNRQKQKTKSINPAKPQKPHQNSRRPWQNSFTTDLTFLEESPAIANSSDDDLTWDGLWLPDSLEASSSTRLAQILFHELVDQPWEKFRRNSYWLSRLTHSRSWLSRFEKSDSFKIPLPDFFTRRNISQRKR